MSIIPKQVQGFDNDHPRMVIPFHDVNNKIFAYQGRSYNKKEQPKYLTIVNTKTKDKFLVLTGLTKLNIIIVEGLLIVFFLDNCIAVAGAD